MENIIKVPTGHICIKNGELKKPLEFLSLGDYGQSNNIKAEFLGFTDEINGVVHGDLLPLEEKWVITISSQYGCNMNCTFCDVPKVGPGFNASVTDLVMQFESAMAMHPEVKKGRINLHYARMGEPTWNIDVIKPAYYLKGVMDSMGFNFHPVVSTMMPKANKNLKAFLKDWLYFKNYFCDGDAGLQLSINSTNHLAREVMFNGNALCLREISEMFLELLQHDEYHGRKITLNFALTGDGIEADYLRELFSPRYFMCKLTPIHDTNACRDNGIEAKGYNSYDIYRDVEESLKDVGFDVLVFVPSREEDESRITCGNAVLSTLKDKNN